jgi:hypothetical protein
MITRATHRIAPPCPAIGRATANRATARVAPTFSCRIKGKPDVADLFTDVEPQLFIIGLDGDYVFGETGMVEVVGGI